MRILISIFFIIIAILTNGQVTSDIAIKLNGEKKYTCKDKKNYNSYNSLAIENGCVFEGELKKCQPWNGKSYCYDKNGLLDNTQVYVDGKYIENGIIKNSILTRNDIINQKDKDGRKTGYWRVTGKMRNLPDYEPDQVIEEGHYKTNRKIGIWKKYWPNGNLKSEIEFKNGRASGSFKTCYISGGIEEKGNWKGRFYSKEYERYYESGCLSQKNHITDENTTVIDYYDDCIRSVSTIGTIDTTRQLEPEIDYERYVRGGWRDDYAKIEHTYCDTCITRILNTESQADTTKKIQPPKYYKDGYHKVYNDNADIWLDGEFKGGRLYYGKCYIYDEYGLLERIEIYKKGKYVGNGVL